MVYVAYYLKKDRVPHLSSHFFYLLIARACMFPTYEPLEESFPELKRQREVEEELRKAEQAHVYLGQLQGNGRVEYMEAADTDEHDKEKTKKPLV